MDLVQWTRHMEVREVRGQKGQVLGVEGLKPFR